MAGKKGSKRANTPRDPFEKERLIREIQLVGVYGLKNKHELWTMEKIFSKDKERARTLLTSTNPEDIPINGRCLLKKLMKYGILNGIDLCDKERVIDGLNKVLDLTINHYLERRLQFRVFAAGLARSVHHARVLIRGRCISIKDQIVDVPGFMVRADKEPLIEYNPYSRFGDKGKKKAEATVERG
ncbi:40S ribosomal protein S9 [Encephalitozoon intestinalis ATCC 50506]|uniref:40S ribosomal protein S9 n=1 Tax=Encephalitozoon intestinalis (strain ATCC 50506) TaxID=876142 RepID=E0S7B5_ENCIT|nr:40S ribosomal protein S9 [Encephalitozoon intestinalis ATCC 50506]ADM11543.1 40S ribosomal protein S9 [Encephalitozoon intestinalis ATCC 50506]UTX45257.1 ribosomal protein S9 [Encephalitozoon intestinalis]